MEAIEIRADRLVNSVDRRNSRIVPIGLAWRRPPAVNRKDARDSMAGSLPAMGAKSMVIEMQH